MSHDLDTTTAEAAILERLARAGNPRRYRVEGASDLPMRRLTLALGELGWVVDGEAAVVTLLAPDAVPRQATGALLVRSTTPLADRSWPGWDPAVLAAGFEGCLRTADWTIYVAPEDASRLGPLLSTAAADDERWDDEVPTASRRVLVAEIVHWRTAALARWARRAADEPERTNKDLLDELARTKSMLDAVERTLSWRITAPLRQVQAQRLRRKRS